MDRFVQLMDALSDCSAKGIGITELCRATLLSKATVHRMLQNMLSLNLVTQNGETKKYSLGPRSMKWGSAFLNAHDPLGLLSKYCNDISEATQFYAFVCLFKGEEIFCTHTHQPSDVRSSFFVHVGQRMPVHCAAAAKIILAYQPENILQRMIDQEDLIRYTEFTTVDRQALLDEYERIRSRQVAVCTQELELGVAAFSVPVFHRPGRTVVSISLVGDYMSMEARSDELMKQLHATSVRASDHLMSMNALSSVF